MTATITLAFLHHAAAFAVVALLTVELVLLRGELTVANARTLLRMDAAFGIAALVLLIVGFLRVFFTEKGAAYYFHSGTFIAKVDSVRHRWPAVDLPDAAVLALATRACASNAHPRSMPRHGASCGCSSTSSSRCCS